MLHKAALRWCESRDRRRQADAGEHPLGIAPTRARPLARGHRAPVTSVVVSSIPPTMRSVVLSGGSLGASWMGCQRGLLVRPFRPRYPNEGVLKQQYEYGRAAGVR